jgi:plasmid maintenance system antidote protein VapI
MIGPTHNRLAELMEAAEVSRLDLAVELGVTEDTIRRIADPTALIPSKYIRGLTVRFGVTADHLLGLDREPATTTAEAA